jgi:hypothetical protein
MENTKPKNKIGIYRINIFILIIFFLFVTQLTAHTVFLKDLNVVYGQVQRQDGENIYLKSEKGMKLIPKKNVAKILFQDINDEDKLKKILKKIRNEQRPSAKIPKKPDPPSTNLEDIEIESAKYMLAEIAREEKEEILQESMLKSIIFPGLGHLHSGRDKTGYFYSTLFIASLGSIAYSTWEVSNAQNEYKDTVQNVTQTAILFNPNLDREISLRHYLYANQRVGDSVNQVNRAKNNQRIAIGSAVGIYLIQLTHNYLAGIWELAEPISSESQDTGFHINQFREYDPYSNLQEIQTKVEYKWTF